MKKPWYVVGIDGGGTKTAAVLTDDAGKVLAEDTAGPSNFQIIGVEQAAGVLFSVIANCCQKAGRSVGQVRSVVAGLTGAGRALDQERMQAAFVAHAGQLGATFERAKIDSDARVALEGAFKGSTGIILIAGTGSIAFGKTAEGEVFRVGGWGRTIGDEGSGYTIGKEGLTAVCKELDGRGKKTLLTGMVAATFGLSNQERIIAEVYRNSFDIASIAPLVIEAASKQDQECARILNRAAFELSEHVRALTLRMERATRGPRQKIPLAFIGSLLTQDNVLSKIVKHKIEFSTPQIMVTRPQSSPAYGAALMALDLLKE